jgi:tRNA threonylcarbamoyladenosine biosynthesis protein TsaB
VRLAALETATAVTAVAVADDDDVAELVADEQRRHTESLLPALAALLAGRGWRAQDLDAVVVDVGPGLFTGLRVGVATAKGLAVATGVGLVGVASTDVLAEAACTAGVAGTVAAVVDVRRGEVVVATYRCEGTATLVEPPSLADPAALGRALRTADGPVVAVGDGARRHRDVLEGVVVRDDLVVPSPAAAIRLARRRLAAGARPAAHDAVHPWYVREADAVANFTVREAP